jgi:hypothetical protein
MLPLLPSQFASNAKDPKAFTAAAVKEKKEVFPAPILNPMIMKFLELVNLEP